MSRPRLTAVLCGCTAAAALAVALVPPRAAFAQQQAPEVSTYRIRINVTAGEAEPGSGDPLRYDEQILGTLSLSRNEDAGEQLYFGRRLNRRVHAVYRGMTAGDPGDPCAWMLDASGPARVNLRRVEPGWWDLSIVAYQKDASIGTGNGSCPSSEVRPEIPFVAKNVLLEGSGPLARGQVYRAFNETSFSLTLTILDVCEGNDFRDGPKDARSEALRDAVVGGLNANGAAAGPEIVGIRQSSLLEFNVRLGPGHVPLPNRACLQQRIEAGEIEEGTLVGVEHLLVGAVQESGGTTRVTVRTVDAATGDVVATGKADASGPDALGNAARQAFAQLGWSFGG